MQWRTRGQCAAHRIGEQWVVGKEAMPAVYTPRSSGPYLDDNAPDIDSA